MADYSCVNRSEIIQGSSSQNDRVFLSGSLADNLLEIVNVDGGGVISFRVDGTVAVAGAKENYCLPAVPGIAVQVLARGIKAAGGQVEVSLVPNANTKYQVSLVPAS